MNDSPIAEGGTGQPTSGSGGLSVPLGVHVAQLRQADRDFGEERDRRYTEVAQEREKALKIKEEADKAALGLAREIQSYKDEKANELREQIASERGAYVDKEFYDARHEELRDSLRGVEVRLSRVEGGTQIKAATIGWLIAALGVFVPVVVVVVNVITS